MKIHSKLLFFYIAILAFLFYGKHTLAAGSYVDEGVAFYAQTSSAGYAIEGIAFYAPTTQLTGTFPVYRFAKSSNGDHFYTISETEKNSFVANTQSGYAAEGIAFYASKTKTTGTTPVYRFQNPTNGFHFFTNSEAEKNSAINNPQWGYIYEGVAFYAFPSQAAGALPVYRFYNSKTSNHFYTASAEEKNSFSSTPVYRFYNSAGRHFYTASENEKSLIANSSYKGFVFEGVAFYVQKTQTVATFPVYRFYNSTTGAYFYTASEIEKISLTDNAASDYKYEGIAFFAPTTQSQGYSPVYHLSNQVIGEHFYTISLSEKINALTSGLGPEISVGLWNYDKPGIMNSPFQIDAKDSRGNPKTYNIRDGSGSILAQVPGGTTTSVTYDDNNNLFEISGPVNLSLPNTNITFDAADGDNTNIVFNTHRSNYIPICPPPPSTKCDYRGDIDKYRGKIKLQYYHTTGLTQFWVINVLNLEQYVWGSAEVAGTGNINHTMVMTTAYRTFGYRRLSSPLYIAYGFRIRSDSSDQNYGGYNWETSHPNVRKAAEQTRGILVTYNGIAATTPYSSWTNGNTITSSSYAWCKGKPDPYGNYNDPYWRDFHVQQHDPNTMSLTDLKKAGNNMIGLTGYGSVRLAADNGWNWRQILSYYYTGIGLNSAY